MSSSNNPHIIGASPDDASVMSYLLLVGKFVHVPGHLSIGSCSEQNARENTLISPQLERGMVAPGAHCNPPGTSMHPHVESTMVLFIKNMYIQYVQLCEICRNIQEYVWECIRSIFTQITSLSGSLPVNFKISLKWFSLV